MGTYVPYVPHVLYGEIDQVPVPVDGRTVGTYSYRSKNCTVLVHVHVPVFAFVPLRILNFLGVPTCCTYGPQEHVSRSFRARVRTSIATYLCVRAIPMGWSTV